MSAFVVSKTHIDALLTAGLVWNPSSSKMVWFVGEPAEAEFQEGQPWGDLEAAKARRRELTEETAGRVGQMLWAENRRSVNHRYIEEDWEEVFEFQHLGIHIDPVVVLDAISCYVYQSCEHPGWERSEAKAFCDALSAHAIQKLPRSGERTWEINDPTIFGNPTRRLGLAGG